MKSNRIDEIVARMFGGWNYVTNLQYHYNGRVWLSWRPDFFTVTYTNGMAQAITCMMLNISLQVEFTLTVVNALNTRKERKNLWSYLGSVSSRCNSPWLVMGDFNTVLNMDDRIGGNPVNLAEVVDFQELAGTSSPREKIHLE
ncbi:hypothetical protein KY284_020046 [Solanum tuberosum]|nr:hypothetical protein KY284_020046 [Solanum tuberosum]